MDQTVSTRRFAELRDCFRVLGRRLSDAQLLELADLYHELLRARRPRMSAKADVVAAPVRPRSAVARWKAKASPATVQAGA